MANPSNGYGALATLNLDDLGLPELPQHYQPITKLSEADRKTLLRRVLDHYEAGSSIYELAHKLGVSHTTLYRRLLASHEGDWREIQAARALADYEQAQRALENASDMIALSRAREQLRRCQWDLERICKRIYGTDIPADLAGRVSIQINVGQPQPVETIEQVSEKGTP